MAAVESARYQRKDQSRSPADRVVGSYQPVSSFPCLNECHRDHDSSSSDLTSHEVSSTSQLSSSYAADKDSSHEQYRKLRPCLTIPRLPGYQFDDNTSNREEDTIVEPLVGSSLSHSEAELTVDRDQRVDWNISISTLTMSISSYEQEDLSFCLSDAFEEICIVPSSSAKPRPASSTPIINRFDSQDSEEELAILQCPTKLPETVLVNQEPIIQPSPQRLVDKIAWCFTCSLDGLYGPTYRQHPHCGMTQTSCELQISPKKRLSAENMKIARRKSH
jgi:hypothetical protein